MSGPPGDLTFHPLPPSSWLKVAGILLGLTVLLIALSVGAAALWVAGVPDDMHCVVTLTSDGHAPQVIADWTAEYESSVTFTAVIAAAPAEVTRIRFRAADGRTLLDLPITA